MNTSSTHRIVIIGAGFGGLSTYRNLCASLKSSDNVHVTIINKTNHFLFTPLLHEVATGALDRHHIVEPIRAMIDTRTNFLQAHVEKVAINDQTVITDQGDISYDQLVIALGSTSFFFSTPGAQKYAHVLKNLKDAIEMKNSFIDAFEQASRSDDPEERKKLLSFVIVGGGATGVELAAELSELFWDTFEKYYENVITKDEVSITMIHAKDKLIEHFPLHMSERARKILEKGRVQIRFSERVHEVTKEGVKLESGEFIESPHVMWLAGVRAMPIDFDQLVDIDKRGRLIINPYLQLQGHPDIFALGDIATLRDEHDKPLPMLAQVAVQQGKIVAHNLCADMHHQKKKTFHFKNKGNLISLGQWQAAAVIGPVKLSGFVAWFVWRTVYLMNFVSWRKRIKIAMDWTINIFSPRDITKL